MSTAPARLRDFLPDLGELPLLFAARGLAAAVAWRIGFRALSDDDYARIAIAQRFAHAPTLDASGTSWLPAPFWLYGAAFRVFGTGLGVARATAVAAGLLGSVLVFVAARLLGTSKTAALIAAALSCLAIPYSTLLGIAAVPEVPCAALIVFGAATLMRPEPPLRAGGGLALALACLSRYEAWPVALVFIAFCVWDAVRERQAAWLWGAALAAAGPALWLAVGQAEHGDALFFIARVTSYRRALGGDPTSTWQRLAEYPLALLLDGRELCGLLLLLFFVSPKREPGRGLPMRRTALAMLALLVFLVLGSVRDGVPTHHAGRVLLPIWFFGCVLAGHLFSVVDAGRRSRAVVVLLFAACAALFGLSRLSKEGFAERSSELEAGREVGKRALSTVAVDTSDYGFFAVQAAFGSPQNTTVLDDHDPRHKKPSPFADAAGIEHALRDARAQHVVVTTAHAALLEPRCVEQWRNTSFVLLQCTLP